MSKQEKLKEAPILVAVDFSEHSEKALIWAARISDCLKAPLLVLHVVHDPESAPGYYKHSKKWKKHLLRMEDAGAEMLAEFVDSVRTKNPNSPTIQKLETKLVVGLPVTRILEVCKKSAAQLIVMGSRGRTGLSHLLLGSKAEKIAQLSTIPVTIVKIPDHEKSDAES